MTNDNRDFVLRPPGLDDIAPYTAFLADPEVSVWLDDSVQRPVPATRVESILLHEAWCLWSIEYEGRFIGVTSLYEPDLGRRTARYSIVIGNRSCWGRGLGTAITCQVVEHAFENLGLQKVNSDYLEANEASRVIHRKIGFVEEGRLRNDAWRGGEWQDRIWLSLLADDPRVRP